MAEKPDEDDILTMFSQLIIGILILAFEVTFALFYATFTIGCWIIGLGFDDD